MKNLLPIIPIIFALFFVWSGYNNVQVLVVPKVDAIVGRQTSIFKDTELYFNYGFYLLAAVISLGVLIAALVLAAVLKRPIPTIPALLITSLVSIYAAQAISAMSAFLVPTVLMVQNEQATEKFIQKLRDERVLPVNKPAIKN